VGVPSLKASCGEEQGDGGYPSRGGRESVLRGRIRSSGFFVVLATQGARKLGERSWEMRRGRIFTGALAVVAAAVISAPGAAFAGNSPRAIAKDLSDGVLNGHYTKAELQRYLQDTTVQGYGGPTGGVVGTTKPSNQVVVKPNVLGTKKTVSPLKSAKVSGALPFTGAQLGLFAAVGLALLGMGLLLRSTARQKSQL
jgi:hypothetical protein